MTNSLNLREMALEILLEVEKNGAYPNVLLKQTLDKYLYMEKQERAFLTRLVEGTVERKLTLEYMIDQVSKTPVRKMSTEEIRHYLADYQQINDCSKVTVDNVRRNISSFFSWLEEEDYMVKSPMKRIHKVKTAVIVKDTIPDDITLENGLEITYNGSG